MKASFVTTNMTKPDVKYKGKDVNRTEEERKASFRRGLPPRSTSAGGWRSITCDGRRRQKNLDWDREKAVLSEGQALPLGLPGPASPSASRSTQPSDEVVPTIATNATLTTHDGNLAKDTLGASQCMIRRARPQPPRGARRRTAQEDLSEVVMTTIDISISDLRT